MSVRHGLAELLRREVLSISADRLSPQRGDYRFAQDLLRQVAYETMSRRDRKARHLAVAAHLRAVFRDDGDEVADVISRHYLDAIAAVPDAPDVADIRAQAVDMLVRAAERSLRAGAPRAGASGFVAAARQTELRADISDQETAVAAAGMWERAARAALIAFDLENALGHSERAIELYGPHGQTRAAARTQALTGDVLRRSGRHGEARERLNAALEVLRPDPDADTITALDCLALVETFSGGPNADALSAEALALGQALDVDAGLLADLLIGRGLVLSFADRAVEAAAHRDYAARLAGGAGDSLRQARALFNLADLLTRSDPFAAADAARAAADLLRRTGAVKQLDVAVSNEVEALLIAGEWDRADQVLHDAIEVDRLGYLGYTDSDASILAALRGDPETAATYAELTSLRTSEDAQDRASAALADAFVADARNEPADALRLARAVLADAMTLGVGTFVVQLAWPLAARIAEDLGESVTVTELFAVLEAHPVGHLPPLLRAECLLARARLEVSENNADANVAFAEALSALRRAPSPYHLANGLLDHGEYLRATDDLTRCLQLVTEARIIATR